MLKKLMIGAAISMILVSGSVFGQITGGDKETVGAGQKSPTVGLNPQPLPPGRRRYQLRRKHKRHPNAITVKQK